MRRVRLAPRVPRTESTTSARTITIGEPVVKLLREHRRAQNERRLHTGRAWQDHEYVKDNGLGSALDPDSMSTAFKRFAVSLGFPAGVRLRDLRQAARPPPGSRSRPARRWNWCRECSATACWPPRTSDTWRPMPTRPRRSECPRTALRLGLIRVGWCCLGRPVRLRRVEPVLQSVCKRATWA